MSEFFIMNKNKKGYLWPLLLIFIGVYLLADNLGLLPKEYLDNFWRLWPLLLVALGLSMILPRR